MAKLLLVVAVAALLSGSRASVTTQRNDLPEDRVLNMANPECTSMFTVTPEARYSTQGNDLGMTETHGVDTRIPMSDPRYANFNDVPGFGNSLRIGADYREYPINSNTDPSQAAAIRALARAQASVPALLEEGATPHGFVRATAREYFAVCVTVKQTKNRWLEIMAESVQPDQQICVTDWNRPCLAENPCQEACGNGNLYACLESPVAQSASSNTDVGYKFYCRDSCDDPDFEFYWRIVASQMQATNGAQPDGENWCGMRDGDDYPSALLEPYPQRYDRPAVFAAFGQGASVTVYSALTLVVLAVVRSLL